MKKFISGLLVGAILASGAAFGVSYIANVAEFKVLVNGNEFVSDPPALVVEGRTYLPLRAMGDALGVPVNWNADLGQAEVGTVAEEQKPTRAVTVNNASQTNDKWKVTYSNCKTLSQVNDYQKASDGKEFLIAFFEVENISSETQTFNLFNLGCYIDDFKTAQTILATQIDGATQIASPSIEAGKKLKGYFAFEVNKNWKKCDISYNDDLLEGDSGDILKFTLSR